MPLDAQTLRDVTWIRGRFLESEADHGYMVVHGHTPGDEPVVKSNRICLDTGAASGSALTAGVFHGPAKPIFLRAR